ncbi:MAG TPA: hypothetical protein VNT79_07505, partial [Phycisphaerae bacterium]|nr:hypothetical protein [Phycisphaerae bacterium]
MPHPNVCLALATLFAFLSTSARALAQETITLKNNLLPGHFTEHRVQRLVTRKIRKGKTEKLVYSRIGRWVQLNAQEPRAARVRVVQMFADGPAKVVSLFNGAERKTPPPADYYGLSKAGTRLHSLERGPSDSQPLLPKTTPVEDAVLKLMLDFAHWPKEAVVAGGKWERGIRERNFEGSQQFEFIELLRGKDETAAV